MKKLILLTTLLASTALAEDNKLYIKANINAAHFNTVDKFTTQDKVKKLEQVPIYCLSFGGGAHLTDNIRTDIMYEQFKATTHSGITVVRDHKLRGNVKALSANVYADLFNTKSASLFVGGGVGLSHVNASHIFVNKVQDARTGVPYKTDPIKSKYKSALNVSYGLHAGISVKVSPNLTTELTYSYKDLGRTKEKIDGKSNTVGFKGHYTGVGFRFDI